MLASVRWLNEYLAPANVTAEGAERALTNAGFPIESHTQLPDGDVRLDVEVTSNRGDCLSHIGLAREIAAGTGRSLKMPQIPADGTGREQAAEACSIDNRAGDGCRMFTGRVIRGVKVAPSPAWLVRAIESLGQRSINNVVDATNFVAAELGQPSHVFDLGTLKRSKTGKPAVTVRTAIKDEKLTLLDGRTVDLRPGELVVADGETAQRAISLAGIMGGAETQVTAKTTDVLLEAATWDPATIRKAARRLGIRTEASHRFERLVDPRTIDLAARRAAALLVQVAGGRLLSGVIEAGPAYLPLSVVRLRPTRCSAILGIDVFAAEMAKVLRAHDVVVDADPGEESGELECTIPAHRPDLEREIDLIEEVARTIGLDRLHVHEQVGVRVTGEQREEKAMRELAGALTGLGFYEAVTVTFVSPKAAAPFMPPGMGRIDVCDERRRAEPTLRPSAIPSLLACRRANKDRGVDAPGGVRLFEVAPVFAEAGGKAVERRNVAMIADAPDLPGGKTHDRAQHAVRLMRGVIDTLAAAMGGSAAKVEVEPVEGPAPIAAYEPGACAGITVNGERLGILGLIAPALQRECDLDRPVVAAELNVDSLLALYPPRAVVRPLPSFPAIERDVSLIVPEAVTWSAIERLARSANLAGLDDGEGGAVGFVGTYRGPQAGEGKKSVTLRLRFRDPERTLRREEVDPQMAALIEVSKRELGAQVRV